MKASMLIAELIEIIAERGDVDVLVGIKNPDANYTTGKAFVVVDYEDGTVGVVAEEVL